MNKIYTFCVAMLALLLTTSCDKYADNKKLEKVSGVYNGNITALLYVPDYEVEWENFMRYSNENSLAIATDMETTAEVIFNFATDDRASVAINNLTGIHFEVQFLQKDSNGSLTKDSDGAYFPRSIYQTGKLAELLRTVRESVVKYDANEDAIPATVSEYNAFALSMQTLVDDLQFENISTLPLLIKESGAVYTTYDFEQNSFYERFSMNPISFKRESNLSAIKQKLNALIELHPADFAQSAAVISNILSAYKTEGVITDCSGWCSITYSNYRPSVTFTIHNATGLLDTMTMALFGVTDDNTSLQELWLMMNYEGTIGSMESYEVVK